jgi:hypothetical protein
VYVNLFIGSEADVTLPGGAVRLTQQTDYPWDGAIRLTVGPVDPAALGDDVAAGAEAVERPLAFPADFQMYVHIPGWSRNEPVPTDLYTFADSSDEAPVLRINGAATPLRMDGGFAVIDRTWSAGDTVELELPMPVRRVAANSEVESDAGRLAIQRGPLVYAIEGVDNGGSALDVTLPADAVLTPEFRPEMLGGVTVLRGEGLRGGRSLDLLAVPYFAWANRGPGEMEVWLTTADR